MSEPKDLFPECVKGVIFDLDDTLVHSTVDYARFKRRIIERIALEGDDPSVYDPEEGIMQLIGKFRQRMMGSGRTSSEVDDLLDDFDEIMDDVEMERVKETKSVPGARELLQMLRDRGLKIGVLTRGCEMYATKALELTDMLRLVDHIECRNSDVPPKPSPESYRRLVKRLGLAPEETLFVGDHHLDAMCARKTGVRFVGVRTGDLTEQELREAGGVEVFDSVADMIPWLSGLLRTSD
ncbi:MAG: HAD family hydrolase [Methanobacteriota archaeon]|nr:MAG: HAD family hydrolase [Euryarchaeota archaeon]